MAALSSIINSLTSGGSSTGFKAFDSNNGIPSQIFLDPNFGGVMTGINPATGQRERVVEGPYQEPAYDSGNVGQNQYGWASENPGNTNYYTADNAWKYEPKDSWLDSILTNPASYLAVLGGGVASSLAGASAAGAGAGADAGMAFGGESALQGSSYLGGSDALLGGAGSDVLGGGMDIFDPSTWGDAGGFDSSGMPNYTSPESSGFDFGQSWNPDAPNAYDSALREAGINPSSPDLMQRVQQWLSNPSNLLSSAGKLLATGLGMYGSNQQANSLQNLANQYSGYGAPSRARYEASMTPGFNPNSIPGYSGALDTASKSILARLSASGGNPFGNPGGLIDANKQIVSGTALPAIQEYQRMNANTGFGNSMNAALNLQTQGIGADANTLNAVGYGINSLTNPQPSLAELIKQLQGGGYVQNTGF